MARSLPEASATVSYTLHSTGTQEREAFSSTYGQCYPPKNESASRVKVRGLGTQLSASKQRNTSIQRVFKGEKEDNVGSKNRSQAKNSLGLEITNNDNKPHRSMGLSCLQQLILIKEVPVSERGWGRSMISVSWMN